MSPEPRIVSISTSTRLYSIPPHVILWLWDSWYDTTPDTVSIKCCTIITTEESPDMIQEIYHILRQSHLPSTSAVEWLSSFWCLVIGHLQSGNINAIPTYQLFYPYLDINKIFIPTILTELERQEKQSFKYGYIWRENSHMFFGYVFGLYIFFFLYILIVHLLRRQEGSRIHRTLIPKWIKSSSSRIPPFIWVTHRLESYYWSD